MRVRLVVGLVAFAVALGLYATSMFLPLLRLDLTSTGPGGPPDSSVEFGVWGQTAEGFAVGDRTSSYWDAAHDDASRVAAYRAVGPLLAGAMGCAVSGIVVLFLAERRRGLRGLPGLLGVVGAVAALVGAVVFAWAVNENAEEAQAAAVATNSDLDYAPGIFVLAGGAVVSAAAAPAGFGGGRRRKAEAAAPDAGYADEPARPAPRQAARTLTCPRCKASVTVPSGAKPTCGRCGYPGAAKPAPSPGPARPPAAR